MREIKFRSWHKTACDMLIDENIGDSFKWLNEGQPVEIMQYTGLKDKNGIEIYEGDILFSKKENYFGDVVYRYGSFVTDCLGFGYSNLGEIDEKEIEIVGNIHQNKELLE